MNSENEIDIENEINQGLQKNNNSYNIMSYITHIFNLILRYKFYIIGLIIVLIIVYFIYYKKIKKSKVDESTKLNESNNGLCITVLL